MQRGYIAIITTLIISAVVVVTTATVALLSIGQADSGFALTNGEQTLQQLSGCAEDALLQSRNSASFGNTPVTLQSTCSITINKASSPWVMDVTTTTTAYPRKIRVTYTRDGYGITLQSWKEI